MAERLREVGLKRAFGAVLYAFHAEDAFGAVCSVSGIVGDIDVHRTYLLTPST